MIYVIRGGKRCGNPLQRFSKKERKVSEEMSRRFHPEIFNAFSLSSRDPTCLTFSRTFLFILLKLLSVDYFLRSCPLTHLCLKLKIVLQLFLHFRDLFKRQEFRSPKILNNYRMLIKKLLTRTFNLDYWMLHVNWVLLILTLVEFAKCYLTLRKGYR